LRWEWEGVGEGGWGEVLRRGWYSRGIVGSGGCGYGGGGDGFGDAEIGLQISRFENFVLRIDGFVGFDHRRVLRR
jgi:hypothetical protein